MTEREIDHLVNERMHCACCEHRGNARQLGISFEQYCAEREEHIREQIERGEHLSGMPDWHELPAVLIYL